MTFWLCLPSLDLVDAAIMHWANKSSTDYCSGDGLLIRTGLHLLFSRRLDNTEKKHSRTVNRFWSLWHIWGWGKTRRWKPEISLELGDQQCQLSKLESNSGNDRTMWEMCVLRGPSWNRSHWYHSSAISQRQQVASSFRSTPSVTVETYETTVVWMYSWYGMCKTENAAYLIYACLFPTISKTLQWVVWFCPCGYLTLSFLITCQHFKECSKNRW